MLIDTAIKFYLNLFCPDKAIVVQMDAVDIDDKLTPMQISDMDGFYLLEISREFLKNGTVYTLIEALGHECVHIAQSETGINDCPALDDNESLDYWFSPDEIQARGLESALAEAFYHVYDIEYIESQPLTKAILNWSPDVPNNLIEFPKFNKDVLNPKLKPLIDLLEELDEL